MTKERLRVLIQAEKDPEIKECLWQLYDRYLKEEKIMEDIFTVQPYEPKTSGEPFVPYKYYQTGDQIAPNDIWHVEVNC